MDFVTLDVETANSDMASICQIGLVDFRAGRVANSWEWLVDPEDYFDMVNVSIHGIDEETVLNQPKWPGETAVFTGTLSIGRREAADLASEGGCEVLDSVTKRTTLLVVGDQDIKKLAGHEKSSKHRKAEQLIAEGQRIRILGESDFKKLLSD
jgi:NAD-dependent DNA ligase